MLNCFSAEVGVKTTVDFPASAVGRTESAFGETKSVKGFGEARGVESRETDMTAGMGVEVRVGTLTLASDINWSTSFLMGARERAVWSATVLIL